MTKHTTHDSDSRVVDSMKVLLKTNMIMYACIPRRTKVMVLREVMMEEIGGLTWEVLRVHESSWSQALEPVTELPAEPPCPTK
jgi:hypothetical protein